VGPTRRNVVVEVVFSGGEKKKKGGGTAQGDGCRRVDEGSFQKTRENGRSQGRWDDPKHMENTERQSSQGQAA